ncbi:MAG: AAA family ATPase, partial [Halobacteriaceae archaeon]
MLAVVCGLPGVGKTTIAKEISHQLDGVILRTDIVRKELFEEPTYSERETDQVYAELLSRAKNHLQEGNDVILDGTFRKQKFRKNAKEIANEEDVVFKLIKVQCDVELVQRRMQERTNDASDATFDIYRR